MTNHLKKYKSLWISIIIVIYLSILPGGFFMYEKVYANKIYPGVYIGGIDLGGKSLEGAKKTIDDKIFSLSRQTVNISINGEIHTLKLSDLGVTFNTNETVDEAFSFARDQNYLQKIPKVLATVVQKHVVNIKPIFSDDKIQEAFKEIAGDSIKEPKNATLKVENNQVIIVLPEQGRKIDFDEMKTKLTNLVTENGFLPNNWLIETNFIQVEANISESDIVKVKPTVEKIISEPIEFYSTEKDFTAYQDEIASWLIIKTDNNKNISISFSDEEIRSFVDYISQKIDRKPLAKKIRSDNNQVIDEGQEGKEVNREDLQSKIKEILNSRKIGQSQTSEIELEIQITPIKEEKILPEDVDNQGGLSGLFEGKYLEIDLSDQMMYLWDGTTKVGEYVVSTGKWSTPTPTGTRYIESKDVRAYSSKYGLYMPWWNSIGGGYGIHELPEWSNGAKEGESHLGTPVSHGCIRLGVGSAEYVYSWADVGTPVYIHK